MKKLLTLVLCWLLAFSAIAETTFKAKTAASVAGGYVTSLNKVDGSFEDVVTQWVASVGTIVKTASTEMQGNNIGVWSGTGAGTLDLQWTATASNTYEASAQVDVQGEDDVYVCAYVGTTETGCKLIPALSKIQKVSVVADSVMSSAFYLRLKHTGSDAFSVKVDDGKIEPWTPQAVNLVEKQEWTGSHASATHAVLSSYSFTSNPASTLFTYSSGYFTALKPITVTVSGVSISSVTNSGIEIHKTGESNGGGGQQAYSTGASQYPSRTLTLSAGQQFWIYSYSTGSLQSVTITASAISENVVQSYAPSDRIGETIYLPQSVAPRGFISAMGSSIGKSAGTHQGSDYYNLYAVCWSMAQVTAGEPYVISSAKGTDALTDWNAGKTITIDESGLFTRAYKIGTSGNVGAKQGDAFQGHGHEVYIQNSYGDGPSRNGPAWNVTSYSATAPSTRTVDGVYRSSGDGTPRTASETRPINVAKYVFIRYATSAPDLIALPTRSEVFSANVAAAGTVTNATQNFVTSCTNATPSVCSLWSNFGVTPICWAHTTDITKRAEVSASTATTATVARTDTGTAFNLFCHLK